MMRFCYLDCETLGLKLMEHDVWEVAWAIDDDPIHSGMISHSYIPHEPKALEVNQYHRRLFGQPHPTEDLPMGVLDDLYELLTEQRSKGNALTIVGANPQFDMYRISKIWGWEEPWHYRSIDLQSMAMPLLKHDTPKGLREIVATLIRMGYDIPINDHTAAGDVATAREVHHALVELATELD